MGANAANEDSGGLCKRFHKELTGPSVSNDSMFTTAQLDCSLQSERTNPTTGTIALQLDDTKGITITRAVAKNQTLRSIGNTTEEAILNV